MTDVLTEREILIMRGVCPECKQHAKANLVHPAFLGPEWSESMRERGISFETGHKNECSFNKARPR